MEKDGFHGFDGIAGVAGSAVFDGVSGFDV
jgi:hypothetical protein